MIFEVRNVEHDDDYWKKVEARDEEEAAEVWARWEDAYLTPQNSSEAKT